MKLHIGCSSPRDFKIGAWLISWWIKKPYSHAFVIFEYSDSKPAVFQASHGMVHFQSLPNFLKDNKIVVSYEIDLSFIDHTEFFDECMDLSGNPYSTKQLLVTLWNDIGKKFNLNIDSPDCEGYVCSELVGKLLVDRLSIKFNKPTYLLSPADVDNRLKELQFPISELKE